MVKDINTKSSDDFMRYATAVIKGRAVPNVDDNLKPVHRRILYTMHEMKLDSKAKTVKSANIVGQCMSLHPHGWSKIRILNF
jgi:DNA gyrase/topoisomerase IV subunit A